MRALLLTSMLAGLMLGAATPAAAAAAAPGFQAWLDRAVERNMEWHTPAALERSNAAGIATVRFSAGPDGRPADVEIVRSSGNVTIDRAARQAIATLRLPAEAPAGPHLAVLQYGSEASYADRSDHAARLSSATGLARLALRTLERERLARAGGAPASGSTLD
jgi:TonB family protein